MKKVVHRLCQGAFVLLLHSPCVVSERPSPAEIRAKERSCCAAIVLEDGASSGWSRDGRYILPQTCRHDGVGCPCLGFHAEVDAVEKSGAEKAFEHQVALRTSSSCDPEEWSNRCPTHSTMLLTEKGGSCLAAGCAAVDRVEGPVIMVEGNRDEETNLLRAITAQHFYVLKKARPEHTKTFYHHTKDLRKSFVKDQARLCHNLEVAMKVSPSPDIEGIRALLDLGILKGIQGKAVDEATVLVAKHDSQQAGIAVLRCSMATLLSTVTEAAILHKRSADAHKRRVGLLIKQVQHLEATVIANKAKMASDKLAIENLYEALAEKKTVIEGLESRLAAELDRYTSKSTVAEKEMATMRQQVKDLVSTVDAMAEEGEDAQEQFLVAEKSFREKNDEMGTRLDSCSAELVLLNDLSRSLYDATKTHLARGRHDLPAEMQHDEAMGTDGEARSRLNAVGFMMEVFSKRLGVQLQVCERRTADLQERLGECSDEVWKGTRLSVRWANDGPLLPLSERYGVGGGGTSTGVTASSANSINDSVQLLLDPDLFEKSVEEKGRRSKERR